MIYQGSNSPLILEFDRDMTDIVDFSAVLYTNNTEQKRWDIDSITINGINIILNLTQEETIAFDAGRAQLECKYSIDGIIYVTEIATTSISARQDKEVLKLED